jgi:hypothetical protein
MGYNSVAAREQHPPTAGRGDQLAQFLALSPESGRCVLYLPQFRGDALLDTGGTQASPLHYPGNTYSHRDARAAFYVTSLLSQILDPENISVENARAESALPGPGQTAFLFGSRSNVLTQRVAEATELRRLFRFDFGPLWKIEFGGEVFAIPDPSQLDEASYRLQNDYGLIARSFDPATRAAIFILAGLGDCATEGCGYFLARNWHALFERFDGRDFALLLAFPAPTEPKRFQLVADAVI